MWRDWEKTNTLSNIATITAGGTPARGVQQYWNGNIPWVTPTEITSLSGEKYLSSSNEYISKEGLANSSAKLIDANSLLVTTRASLGLRAVNRKPVTTNQGFKSLTFHKEYSTDFYYHLMPLLQKDLEARASGTTFLEISGTEFGKTIIPTPELYEQKAIAEVLDTVDEAIAATQAMLDKQDKIKDGLLQDLLTRGVDANGKLRNEKQSLNGTLSDVVNLVNHKIAIGKNPDLPYIGLEHLDKRTLHISRHGNALDSVSTNNVFSPNDILFGKLRPNLKKCALAETHGYCSTDILVLRANANINPLFALYICSSEPIFYEAIKSTEGTKMPRTSWAAIKDVPVYLPDTEEQNSIVAVMDSHLQKKRDTENELNKLKKLKAGLMQDLLTGKKRISKNQREAA